LTDPISTPGPPSHSSIRRITLQMQFKVVISARILYSTYTQSYKMSSLNVTRSSAMVDGPHNALGQLT